MATATATSAATGESDRRLVERHRYGDSQAFEELYERFNPMVYNLALRMTGEPADAADLSQEIFLRVYRHLGKFRGRSSLKTWVYRVAINCCRSRYRHQLWWRRDRISEPAVLESLADRRRGPEDRALAQDAGETVHRALRQLPVNFREAVVLRDIEGLSYEEIATITGLRLGTVRSRIARGRDRLRLLLENES
jgi:RNA polymerase sigma-70 factor (ECF subfamily)